MKKITILIFMLFSAGAFAQSYVERIEQIAARSLAVKAFRAKFTADSLQQRRGLNPDDPEVAMDYFFDNNVEMRIEQSVDFPTVYVQRGKLSRLGIERAGVDFRLAHWDLMNTISTQYISLTYYDNLVRLLDERSSSLTKYVAQVEHAVSVGDAIKLDLVNAQTLAQQMQSELAIAKSELQKCRNQLRQWGYTTSEIGDYPQFSPITHDEFIIRAKSVNISLEAIKVDSMIAQRTLRLSRNEWLPKLKVGYRMDIDDGLSKGAIVAGISIPLWQNRGNVKHSKALIKSVEAQQAETEQAVNVSLENIYAAFEATENAQKLYPQNGVEHNALLQKSLSSGTITLTDYLLTVIERYSVEQRRMELEMQSVQNRAAIELLMTR